MAIEERRFASMVMACQATAEAMAKSIGAAIESRGSALLAVSGGRTLQKVFKCLRQTHLDWPKVVVTLTDERWVPVDSDDSNEQLARHHILHGPAQAARFVSLYGGEATPLAGYQACEQRLSALSTPFNAIYLGKCEDGHIAPLFPGDAATESDGGLCVPVPATGARQAGMSLMAHTLLSARTVFLPFSGEAKRRKYQEAIQPCSSLDLPPRMHLHQSEIPARVLSAPLPPAPIADMRQAALLPA